MLRQAPGRSCGTCAPSLAPGGGRRGESLAREARRRGVVPITSDLLGALVHLEDGTQPWLGRLCDHSLLVVCETLRWDAEAASRLSALLIAIGSASARTRIVLNVVREGSPPGVVEVLTPITPEQLARAVVVDCGAQTVDPSSQTKVHERPLDHAADKCPGSYRPCVARVLSRAALDEGRGRRARACRTLRREAARLERRRDARQRAGLGCTGRHVCPRRPGARSRARVETGRGPCGARPPVPATDAPAGRARDGVDPRCTACPGRGIAEERDRSASSRRSWSRPTIWSRSLASVSTGSAGGPTP